MTVHPPQPPVALASGPEIRSSSMSRLDPQMPPEIRDLATKMFREGKSVTQAQAVIGTTWGVKTLAALKAVAGRGV